MVNTKNPAVLDGEHWSLTIYYNGKKIDCAGSNAYPTGLDEFKQRVDLLIPKSRL